MKNIQETKPEDFRSYFEYLIASQAKASKLLLKVLSLIDAGESAKANPHAVDLGCGIGQETAELLSRGWSVDAIDFSQEGIDRLLARPEASANQERLHARVQSFSDADWQRANLVLACASLPYGPPACFDAVWNKIVNSLEPGGYFAGNFFGPDHHVGMTHIVRRSRSEVEAMLAGLEVIQLEEVHRQVPGAEEPFFYHYFDVIARKPVTVQK
ncbi:MAG TPA: class I SAM-dependent methyltransferase [Oculatellaceae cyanobacterium]